MTLGKREMEEAMKSRLNIPKFYFATGKPIDEEKKWEQEKLIETTFDSPQINEKKFEPLTKGLFGIPKFFTPLLFSFLSGGKDKLNWAEFL